MTGLWFLLIGVACIVISIVARELQAPPIVTPTTTIVNPTTTTANPTTTGIIPTTTGTQEYIVFDDFKQVAGSALDGQDSGIPTYKWALWQSTAVPPGPGGVPPSLTSGNGYAYSILDGSAANQVPMLAGYNPLVDVLTGVEIATFNALQTGTASVDCAYFNDLNGSGFGYLFQWDQGSNTMTLMLTEVVGWNTLMPVPGGSTSSAGSPTPGTPLTITFILDPNGGTPTMGVSVGGLIAVAPVVLPMTPPITLSSINSFALNVHDLGGGSNLPTIQSITITRP